MRTTVTAALIIVILATGTYWYREVQAVCSIPLPYRIGDIDNRFGLTEAEAQAAAADAEAVWEETVGRDVFVYDADARIAINFVFDERHALTDAERTFKERLSAAEGESQAFQEEYEALVEEYEALEARYDSARSAYDERLAAYNADVAAFNRSNRQSDEEFNRLEAEQAALDTERADVNELVAALQNAAEQINELGHTGNQLLESYNHNVSVYNQTFGHNREFTQGDYRTEGINIYTYRDREDLVLVLAHELGHAIGVGHVDSEASIMYHLIGKQPRPLELSPDDMAAFDEICDNSLGAFWTRLKYRLGVY